MKFKLISLFALYFLSVSFSSYDVSTINMSLFKERVLSYEGNIEKSYSSSDNDALQAVQLDFLSTHHSAHYNDINTNKVNSSLYDYVSDIKKVRKSAHISAEIYNNKFYPCTYYSPVNSNSYAIATCTKEMIINNKKSYYNLIIEVDISNPNKYVISSVTSKETHKNMLPSCETTSMHIKGENKKVDIEKETQTQAKTNIDKGDEQYRLKNYFEAIKWYQAALDLLPNSDIAQDRIIACNKLIDSNKYKNKIESIITQENYAEALQLLIDLKDPNSVYTYDEDWYKEKKQICDLGIKRQEFESVVSSGDYYYNNHMYREAKRQYKKALNMHIDDSLLSRKIQLCNEGNPNYVRNEIKKAYNNAVRSKKYWTNTFRTYLKYENSGFLTGENYYFMCLMMLENKKVARNMGYSKALANSLSIEYYFKAKRLGCSKCDMAFLENQVFTKSIYRH